MLSNDNDGNDGEDVNDSSSINNSATAAIEGDNLKLVTQSSLQNEQQHQGKEECDPSLTHERESSRPLLLSARESQHASNVMTHEGNNNKKDDALVLSSLNTRNKNSELLRKKHDEKNEASCSNTMIVKLLKTLGINGVLCHRFKAREGKTTDSKGRTTRHEKAIGRAVRTGMMPRSDLTKFLRLLNENFTLTTWASARLQNAHVMLDLLLIGMQFFCLFVYLGSRIMIKITKGW